MREPNHGRETIRRFLLGDLNDEAREQVEKRIFTDGEYRQEVLIVEDELLEEYALGELSEPERELFQVHYLSTPRQMQKLRVSRALNKYAASHVVPLPAVEPGFISRLIDLTRTRNRLPKLVFVTLLGVLVFAGFWFARQTWRARSYQARLNHELAQLNSAQSLAAAPDSSVVALTFPRVQLRDPNSRVNVAKITDNVTVVRLQIPLLATPHESFQASLRTSGGSQVLTMSNLKPLRQDHSNMLVLQLPARILTNNDYQLTVRAANLNGQIEDVGDYSFRVETAK